MAEQPIKVETTSDKLKGLLAQYPHCRRLVVYKNAVLKDFDSFDFVIKLLDGYVSIELIVDSLPNIQSLAIHGFNLEYPHHALLSLGRLKLLSSLDLSDNKISNQGATALSSLTHLKVLVLSNNNIDDRGAQSLAALQNLVFLRLGYNKIGSEGAKALSSLTKLHSLYLSNNKIGDSGAAAISELKRLAILDLYNNDIGDLGAKSLSQLPKLSTLYLDSNKIGAEGARCLAQMISLKCLDLSSNQIGSEGAKKLSALTNLTALIIGNNKIGDTALPSLSRLTNLKNLDIQNNPITDLSSLLNLLKDYQLIDGTNRIKQARNINISDCPISHPPREIINQGVEAILKYFGELKAQGETQLFEAKMLVVGEGGVGKTSLIRRLFSPKRELPKDEETTKGIDIDPIRFPISDNREFRLNVWDFGGQHIYHATHQFFLTKRSLYILVDSSRTSDKTVQDETFKYWLEVTETLSDNSPVIMFQNQIGGRSKAIDKRGIQSRFSNIKDFFESDLLQPDDTNQILSAVEHHAQQLPHIGDKVPQKWLNIRNEIESLATEKPFISQQDYFDIYARHLDYNRDKALFLSQYFHDLGIFLHFQEDINLQSLVILQNEWATEAVFKILDDEIVKHQGGVFNLNDCKRIWNDSHYQDMLRELLALMVKFELCYALPDTQPQSWLATQLLPPSMPEDLETHSLPDVRLRYHYDFMPKGIVNRLMVRMNRFVKHPELAWANGVVFEKANTELLVQVSNTGNEIDLSAKGSQAKALISVIANDLDAINHSFEGLKDKVNKFIPCICETCKNTDTPHLFEESKLIHRKDKGRYTVECEINFDEVSVLELLEGLRIDLPQWAGDKAEPQNNNQSPRSELATLKTVQIFLASSQELASERDEFELFVRQQSDRLLEQGVYLKVVRWENFLDCMSESRMQDEYNKAVISSDIFVSLFKTKAGKYTEEEFDTAYTQFIEHKKPKIYTYFYDAPTSISNLDKQSLQSLWGFQEKLKSFGHFYTEFKSVPDLKVHFRYQLDLLLEEYAA
ncbi:COR domain-containing protein [Sessilibacter corallicola]|uniref:non-specific serine/threonine protein kinase n=1 Tax=Sessilibacter corallicola TaxID=2904075 RepID=A0ABQ0A8C2_9GAMM